AFLAFFCWLYKEVASRERSPRGTAWLFTRRSDLAMAILLGIATFSKPTNALLFAAPALWWLFRSLGAPAFRREGLTRLATSAFLFVLIAGGLFGVNMLIS